MKQQDILEAFQVSLPHHFRGNVIVIGAGIAGISATHILQKNNVPVKLLEASSHWGGRIRTLQNFASSPIDIGAEEIHGNKTALFALAKQQGIDVYAYEKYLEDYYFFENRLWSEKDLESDELYQQTLSFWDEIEHYEKEAHTLRELIEKRIHSRFQHLVEAWLSASYGTDTANICVQDFLETYRKWNAGEQNYALQKAGYMEIFENYFQDAIQSIQYGKEIVSIDFSQDILTLTTTSQEVFEADKVIITIPISILQKNKIQFSPTLPISYQTAIQQIKIDTGMKIILQFREAFWNEDTGSIYGKGLVPEFYVSSKGDEAILTAYIMGEKARKLSEMGENAIYEVLFELDTIFGNRIASNSLENHYLMDWGKEPFIEGAYSYPSQNSNEARRILATPLDNKLYFAGEAINTNGHQATVHGAIESAYKAVRQILNEKE